MYYKQKNILLASKHEKERAIAKPFMSKLSCKLEIHDFDTDTFGTFTGEIARTLNPYETCLLKAKTAAKQYGYKFAVASEGSFGPHPTFPFIPIDHELMVFIDREHDWVISEQLISEKTNYSMIHINPNSNVKTFLEQVHFPSHALIIQGTTDKRVFAKGINTITSLNHHLKTLFKTEKELLLGTDMRAMMNPTRMEIIRELANKLASKIATLCIKCQAPGFGCQKTHGALPCELCSAPTSLYKEEVWGCIQCDHQEFKMRKDGLLKADPTYCFYCNP